MLLCSCRTEFQASTIKYLRETKQINEDEKDVKIDLILFNSQLGDVLACEDKSAEAKESKDEADIKKARDLREKRLQYIQSLHPCSPCIQHIKVVEAQFYSLLLTVYRSRDGISIHYQKSIATIPTQASNMPQVAHFLLTVMFLQVSVAITLIVVIVGWY